MTEKAIYRDPAQPVEARVLDLLGRMTLQEKVGQLPTFFVGGPGGLLSDMRREDMRAFMVRMGVDEAAMAELPGPDRRRPSLLNEDGTVDAERARERLQSSPGGSAAGVTSFAPR